MVFYPKDDSPVCTKQVCDYNDNIERFIELGLKVVAVNIDDKESHKEFSEKYNLKFPLLSDKNKEVSGKYDALGLLGLSKRKIVVISTADKIIYEETTFPANYRKTEYLLNKLTQKKSP